jgi:hypothetical protein
MAESEVVSLNGVTSIDEATVLISNLVRSHGVNAVLHDDLDADGNLQVTLFGNDDAAVYDAECELDPSRRYTDNV